MRRFDTPPAPPGWVGQGAELLRIVDPTGRAITWLAPGYGATCVGYAVREAGPAPGPWRQVLRSGSPRALLADPLAYGCAILGPEPDGRGGAHLARWRFVERDPTAATCAIRCGDVALTLAAALEDAALHLNLRATNGGEGPMPIALGFRFCLADGFAHRAAPAQPPIVTGLGLTLRFRDAGEALIWRVAGRSAGSVVLAATAATTMVAPGAQRVITLVVSPDA